MRETGKVTREVMVRWGARTAPKVARGASLKVSLGLLAVLQGIALGAVGCSTPPDVTLAHKFERQALEAYRADVRVLSDAFLADLDLAWRVQRDKVLDYELMLREDEDGKIDLGAVETLIGQARAKEQECAGKIKRIQGTVESAEANYRVAVELHGAVEEWLAREGVTEEDQSRFIETAAEAASKITRERKEED